MNKIQQRELLVKGLNMYSGLVWKVNIMDCGQIEHRRINATEWVKASLRTALGVFEENLNFDIANAKQVRADMRLADERREQLIDILHRVKEEVTK